MRTLKRIGKLLGRAVERLAFTITVAMAALVGASLSADVTDEAWGMVGLDVATLAVLIVVAAFIEAETHLSRKKLFVAWRMEEMKGRARLAMGEITTHYAKTREEEEEGAGKDWLFAWYDGRRWASEQFKEWVAEHRDEAKEVLRKVGIEKVEFDFLKHYEARDTPQRGGGEDGGEKAAGKAGGG